VFAATITVANTHYFFNPNEFELGVSQLVDHTICVWNVLAIMQIIPSLFKTLTNVILSKFEKLVAIVVPTIKSHVRSSSDTHIICGWSTKLTKNNSCFNLSCKWNMTMLSHLMHLCGIEGKVMCVMMQFLLHLALMRLWAMKFDGLQLKNGLNLVHKSLGS